MYVCFAISSHHGSWLCEPFNICLNNAAAFHKPGAPLLIPGFAAQRSLRKTYREYFFFPPRCFNISFIITFPGCPLFPISHSSPPAVPLTVDCTYYHLLLGSLGPLLFSAQTCEWKCVRGSGFPSLCLSGSAFINHFLLYFHQSYSTFFFICWGELSSIPKWAVFIILIPLSHLFPHY